MRTPTGFHIVRLDGTRGGESGPVMVEQLQSADTPDAELSAGLRDRRASACPARIRYCILAGEDFAALASVTSEDPGSASRGGDLGLDLARRLLLGVGIEEAAKPADRRDRRAGPVPQFGWTTSSSWAGAL